MLPVQASYTALSRARVRFVHQGNFSSDFTPFELSFDALTIGRRRVIFLAVGGQGVVAVILVILVRAKQLLPFEQLVSEPEMRLNDDVESSSTDKTVGSREGHAHGAHHFSNADGGRT